MDIILARCRNGEKGIGDIFQSALQNCIIDKNAALDSPKKPVHHRDRSQLSFLSTETTMTSPRPGMTSPKPGVDPEVLDSWKTVLTYIDALLCYSPEADVIPESSRSLGDPLNASEASFVSLKDLMQSTVHEERMYGMRWIRDFSMSKLEQCLKQEDKNKTSVCGQRSRSVWGSPNHPRENVSKEGRVRQVMSQMSQNVSKCPDVSHVCCPV